MNGLSRRMCMCFRAQGQEAQLGSALSAAQFTSTSEALSNALPTPASSSTLTEFQVTTEVLTTTGTADPAQNPALAAWQNGALGFSFSGGGFLLPYYCGVVHQLIHMELIRPGHTHLAGSSAGSLIAACVNAGVSTQKVLATCLAVAANCRHHGVHGRLAGFLSAQLHEHLPLDAHVRCSGWAHVGVTRLWPVPKSKVVSEFHSREELVAALMASCHLPLLSDGNFTTLFRGKRVMDGGMTALIPLPPAASMCGHVVKVSCLPRAHIPHIPIMNKKEALKGLEMAPDMFEREWPHTVNETLAWALNPGPHAFLISLVDRGSRDALAWATANGLAKQMKPHLAQLAPALDTVEAVPEVDPRLVERAGARVHSDPPARQPTLAKHKVNSLP